MFSSIQEVFTYTVKEKKNPELLASVMWTLWHRRNRICTLTIDFPLAQIVPTTTQALEVFQQAISNDDAQFKEPARPRIRWSPPVKGEIKVNFDEA